MDELTTEQIAAFEGLNASYIEMEKNLEAIAPRCHMKPMFFDHGDATDYYNKGHWECSVCGHTKEAE